MTNTLTLSRGGFSGGLRDYTVQEDATGVDPAARSGGVGQSSATVNATPDTKFALRALATLATDYGAVQEGRVLDVVETDGNASLTIDSVLGRANSDHTVPPLNTSVRGAITNYLARVGIVPTFDAAVPSATLAFPGWRGNLWEHLKDLLIAHKLEIAVTGSTVVVRPLRKYELANRNLTTETYSASQQNASRQISVSWYNNLWRTNGEYYPGPEETNPTVYQVGAGATLTFTLQVSATLASVNQPTCVSYVAPGDYSGGAGVYAVAGNDGNPITPDHWASRGGRVAVRSIENQPGTVEVTVIGMSDESYAPYSLAVIGVGGALYNSLHLTGTGTFTRKETAILETGSSTAVTGEAIGTSVQNIFFGTPGQAFDLGLKAAQNKNLNVSWSASTNYPKRSDGATGDALAYTAGARVKVDDAYYRVNSAGFTADQVSLDASLDTLASDFNAVWAGATIAQFNAQWAGRMVEEFNLIPLRRASP